MSVTPEQMRHFAEFEQNLRPLMERFDQLTPARRKAFVESVLGAHIQEAEKANGGNLKAACDRTLKMADTLLKRQEGIQTITVYVSTD